MGKVNQKDFKRKSIHEKPHAKIKYRYRVQFSTGVLGPIFKNKLKLFNYLKLIGCLSDEDIMHPPQEIENIINNKNITIIDLTWTNTQ